KSIFTVLQIKKMITVIPQGPKWSFPFPIPSKDIKMIRAVIADDEAAAIAYIKSLAEDLAKDVEIAGTATNGYEALQVITEQKPDLVFLDIDMPGMSGMEILKKMPQRDFEVIFTTGYSKYSLQAIKMQAADYLLKSIDP